MSKPLDRQTKPVPDEDLGAVTRCRNGEIEAFGCLVEKHQKRMLNIAYRMIGNYAEACDATQEAFLSAFRALKNFRGQATFATWMTGIVLNQARTRLRRMKRRSQFEGPSLDEPLDNPHGRVFRDPPGRDAPAADQMERKETEKAVQDCIESLDPEYREAVVLRDIQGFSYEEIRDILGVPEGTVKSRIFRAREILKERLKRKMEG